MASIDPYRPPNPAKQHDALPIYQASYEHAVDAAERRVKR
jgi:hypothetical protein